MNEEDDGHTKSYLLQLEKMNINFGKIERNLPIASLIEIAIQRNEGLLSNSGALCVKTGKFTGRSPDDKFIVDDEISHKLVDWGKVNHPIATEKFDKIFERMKQHVSGKDFFIFDGFVGADPDNRLSIRVFTDSAWHNIFASQIFIRPTPEDLNNHKPEFTLFFVNDFASLPAIDGTKSGTFIIINFSKKMEQNRIHVMIFTSPSAVRNFFSIMQNILSNFREYFRNIDVLISIGPNTTKELVSRNVFPADSEEHTIEGTLNLAKRILSGK